MGICHFICIFYDRIENIRNEDDYEKDMWLLEYDNESHDLFVTRV